MKTTLATTCLVAAMLMAPVVSQAADSDADRSQPVTFVKDSTITTKVKAKLAANHPASFVHVKVDTDKDGVVWLSGVARTQAEADRATSIARNTDGVRAVKNNIEIKADN